MKVAISPLFVHTSFEYWRIKSDAYRNKSKLTLIPFTVAPRRHTQRKPQVIEEDSDAEETLGDDSTAEEQQDDDAESEVEVKPKKKAKAKTKHKPKQKSKRRKNC